ncbi:uncharacterized protein LOC124540780 isoform X2 [Vanessa cardui]|uniref:uncharacterized protein LOC124540780 isoform X2 n=1 Tax=Vanessa cardui TaxID=171605 RepID=UPI001F147D84|nr:uncharacterized protein LOC124540780 isoform X2 [Vanessa cardui]
MKVLVVFAFCLVVVSALPAPNQQDDDDQQQQGRRQLNSVRLQRHSNQLGQGNSAAAQRTYYGKSYDLGSLSFRYYSPYYHGSYKPPYYDTADYYNKYNRYYKPTYGNNYGYGYDANTPYYGQGYTNTYYNQGYAYQPYLRQQDDDDEN